MGQDEDAPQTRNRLFLAEAGTRKRGSFLCALKIFSPMHQRSNPFVERKRSVSISFSPHS
jgi:hypothetical protein